MLLNDLATASAEVTKTASRLRKTSAMATALRQAGPGEIELAAHYLGGTLRQRRTGVGWRSLQVLPPAAAEPSLTIGEVDAALQAMAEASGAGSQKRRSELLEGLLSRATPGEQRYLVGLLTGELRQGALDGVLLDAVAEAAGVPGPLVRRAAMMAGSTPLIAEAALTGGADALSRYDLKVGAGVRPMLASSAKTVGEAMAKVAPRGGDVAVEAKLDGIRVQAHKDGDDVRVFSRSLDDLTARLPGVVDAVRAIDATTAILDGEALLLEGSGRPAAFQDTASRGATRTAAPPEVSDVDEGALTPWFFDLLYLDGRSLVDLPLRERSALLAERTPARFMIERTVTDLSAVAEAFNEHVLAQGHEGVVVKNLDAPYDAGRRGAGWVKVKPVHTLDLIVLAVEWGGGRRRGKLSNIHLGARDDETGAWVMLGKTFKGMTDEMLAWQTERFLELEERRDGYTVYLRPEQVVEIAFDGLQRSTRYPGGLALRFARLLRYRDDLGPDDVDTMATVRQFALRSGEGPEA
ncbi:ATP-dependent DNA ligase [Nigerium massiliense]|uniref:ATP-dependent DNA ligase n=1 Tax=Nigerium massiliense TaxID=1522317 RepID=UPI00058F4F17|nr:ATP-dependent DNA ligase [Nigerium massiliense]